jgi:hypothetical protein
VWAADGGHLDDLAVDQLRPVLSSQDPNLGHPVVFVDGEPPPRRLDWHPACLPRLFKVPSPVRVNARDRIRPSHWLGPLSTGRGSYRRYIVASE